MAPSPPYRRGSHRPRVDSQQETGNPGRRNPQRQGVGRHCGRSTGVALYLMHTCFLQKDAHAHTKTPKHRPTQTPPPPEKPTRTKTRNEKNTEPANERRRRRKKKTGAGRSLGEGENEEVRVEGGVRVQDEETLGETQTPQGFVVPQHLRERQR